MLRSACLLKLSDAAGAVKAATEVRTYNEYFPSFTTLLIVPLTIVFET
jgi:hypothetical protein